jgi:probable F420-dependent oxidoreductase
MPRSALGISLPLPGLALHEHRRVVDTLAEAGYGEIWTAESDGSDALMPLALFAGWRRDVVLTAALINVFTRGPALIAMSAATLGDLAPGRARFCLGTGSDVIVERWNGMNFERPYTRVAETLRLLRRLLSGQPSSERFETLSVDGFRLARPPAQPPALALGALGPRMLRLAATEADAVVLNWLSVEDARRVGQDLRAWGAERKNPPEVLARVFVAPFTDPARAEAAARRHVTAYLNVPVYATYQRWLGRNEALEDMWRLWSQGRRRESVEAVPASIVSDLVIKGAPEECASHLHRYADAGLDALNVWPVLDADADSSSVVEFLIQVADAFRAGGP